jgi:hypothetical protein
MPAVKMEGWHKLGESNQVSEGNQIQILGQIVAMYVNYFFTWFV